MKILQLYYPDSRHIHPKEDAWAIDEKNKIFAVADGVGMQPGIEYKKIYPNPSSAGKLAQKFCDSFVKHAKNTSIQNAFRKANRLVFVFNKARDKFDITKAEVYYAATAAFGKVRGSYFEYGHICDAGALALDKSGKIIFWENKCHSDSIFENYFGHLSQQYSKLLYWYLERTILRNALGPNGEKLAYGVITGEKQAEKYAVFGKIKIKHSAVYILSTDGFDPFIRNKDFRRALLSLDKKIIELVMQKIIAKARNKKLYLSEKTLIAFKF